MSEWISDFKFMMISEGVWEPSRRLANVVQFKSILDPSTLPGNPGRVLFNFLTPQGCSIVNNSLIFANNLNHVVEKIFPIEFMAKLKRVNRIAQFPMQHFPQKYEIAFWTLKSIFDNFSDFFFAFMFKCITNQPSVRNTHSLSLSLYTCCTNKKEILCVATCFAERFNRKMCCTKRTITQ